MCPFATHSVINYALHNEHLRNLASMATIASRPNMTPFLSKNLAQYEQYYGFTAASILQPNMTPLESAYHRLKELIAAGVLPTPSDTSRFTYPSFRGDIAEEMDEDMGFYARNNTAATEKETESSAPKLITMPYADSPSDVEASLREREEREVDQERRRKEQELKQAKVLAEKEQEAQQRKLIKEQIEKDRLERVRQEESRKAARLAEQQQQVNATSQSLAASSLQPPSVGNSPGSTSPAVSPRKTSPPIAVPTPSTNTEQPTYRSAGHWAVRETTPPNGSIASSSHTSSHHSNQPYSSHHQPNHASAAASSSSHSSIDTYGGQGSQQGLPPAIYTQYRVHLERLRQEETKVLNMLKTLEALQRVNPSMEVNDSISTYQKYLSMYQRDIVAITKFLKTEGLPVNQNPLTAPPPEPTGFVLRDPSRDLVDEDEEEVEPHPLEMSAGAPTWRVRVQLPQGDQQPVTITLNPSHTVRDLLHHIATLTPITTSFKLEVVGKPGELDAQMTAEQAGLRSTTLRLSRR